MTDAACLLTPRLRLRPLQPGDVPGLYAIQGNPEAMRYTHCAPSLDHAFGLLALAEVDAYAMAENQASIRVLQKCGFAFLRHEPALARHRYRVRRPMAASDAS